MDNLGGDKPEKIRFGNEFNREDYKNGVELRVMCMTNGDKKKTRLGIVFYRNEKGKCFFIAVKASRVLNSQSNKVLTSKIMLTMRNSKRKEFKVSLKKSDVKLHKNIVPSEYTTLDRNDTNFKIHLVNSIINKLSLKVSSGKRSKRSVGDDTQVVNFPLDHESQAKRGSTTFDQVKNDLKNFFSQRNIEEHEVLCKRMEVITKFIFSGKNDNNISPEVESFITATLSKYGQGHLIRAINLLLLEWCLSNQTELLRLMENVEALCIETKSEIDSLVEKQKFINFKSNFRLCIKDMKRDGISILGLEWKHLPGKYKSLLHYYFDNTVVGKMKGGGKLIKGKSMVFYGYSLEEVMKKCSDLMRVYLCHLKSESEMTPFVLTSGMEAHFEHNYPKKKSFKMNDMMNKGMCKLIYGDSYESLDGFEISTFNGYTKALKDFTGDLKKQVSEFEENRVLLFNSDKPFSEISELLSRRVGDVKYEEFDTSGNHTFGGREYNMKIVFNCYENVSVLTSVGRLLQRKNLITEYKVDTRRKTEILEDENEDGDNFSVVYECECELGGIIVGIKEVKEIIVDHLDEQDIEFIVRKVEEKSSSVGFELICSDDLNEDILKAMKEDIKVVERVEINV